MVIDKEWQLREEKWKLAETASMAALRVGMKVFPQAGTCSRYACVVGEFIGFTEEHGQVMAVVKFPPVEKYNEYFETWKAMSPWNQSYGENPFEIYKNETKATYWASSLNLVEDESVKPGDLVQGKVWENATHPISTILPNLKKVEFTR